MDIEKQVNKSLAEDSLSDSDDNINENELSKVDVEKNDSKFEDDSSESEEEVPTVIVEEFNEELLRISNIEEEYFGIRIYIKYNNNELNLDYNKFVRIFNFKIVKSRKGNYIEPNITMLLNMKDHLGFINCIQKLWTRCRSLIYENQEELGIERSFCQNTKNTKGYKA